MRRRGWILAIALLAVSNLVALIGVARNRSGEPETTIELTERELPLAFQPEESTGVVLKLRVNRDGDQEWLDETMLERLGFDCSVPLSAETQELHYDKQLPREGFLVLEFDGAAWNAWLLKQQAAIEETSAKVEQGQASEETLERERERLERSRVEDSRLFPVDAGRDPVPLRAEYADRARYLIVPAVFELTTEAPEGPDASVRNEKLRGRIAEFLVRSIHVGKRHRKVFDSLEPRTDPDGEAVAGPRYSATVAIGTRFEPWLVDARPGAEKTPAR